MKAILIAATIVGAAAAGLILYFDWLNSERVDAGNVVDAAAKAYDQSGKDNDLPLRPAQHAMG